MHFGRENRISQRKVPEDIIEPLPTSNNFFLNSDNYLEHKITANNKANLGDLQITSNSGKLVPNV